MKSKTFKAIHRSVFDDHVYELDAAPDESAVKQLYLWWIRLHLVEGFDDFEVMIACPYFAMFKFFFGEFREGRIGQDDFLDLTRMIGTKAAAWIAGVETGYDASQVQDFLRGIQIMAPVAPLRDDQRCRFPVVDDLLEKVCRALDTTGLDCTTPHYWKAADALIRGVADTSDHQFFVPILGYFMRRQFRLMHQTALRDERVGKAAIIFPAD